MRLLTLVFSILLFTCSNLCNAQTDTLASNKNHKLILSVSAGAAIPIGKFSKFETEKYAEDQSSQEKPFNIAGPARTGFDGKIDLTYLFVKNVGFTFMFFTTVNEAAEPDSAALIQSSDPPSPLSVGNVLQSYQYTVKKWYTNSLLIGPVFVGDYKKFRFNFKLAVGVQQVQCPGATLDEKGYLGQINGQTKLPYTFNTIQPQLTSYSFVLAFGTEVQFILRKRFGFLVSVDYLTSLAHFKGESSYTYSISDGITTTSSQGTQSRDFYKYVSLLNINAGVCYTFK
jgi:hypothetical protein